MMLSDNCRTDAKKQIIELINIEKARNDNKEAFFRYYDFLKNKQDFVTVKSDSKDILLFTKHKTESTGGTKKNVYLWMSDGNRLQKIGKITVDVNTVTPISFLFANDKLFFLDQQLEGKKIKSVKLTYLEEQSTTARTIINAWSSTDAKILEPYSGKKVSKVFCNMDGFVGFLFDNHSSNEWQDECDYANATVTSGEKAPEGIKLKGKEGKAVWSIGETEKEDQPYNFADLGFTLVATVKIDTNDRERGNSLLGLVLNKADKRFGLWCNKDKTFIVKIKDEDAPLKVNQKECGKGKMYIITFVYEKEKNLEIYVDGEQLAVFNKYKITITAPETIKYFYFGVESQTEQATSDVTITNVLLYNWPFKEEKK